MLLSISVSGGHQCPSGGYRFAPGDLVHGQVQLQTSEPLDITSISVTFLGEQEGKAVADGASSGWMNAKLLETTNELLHRDRYAGEPLLAAGTYSWPYSFAFPELPDHWDTQKLQSRYPASFLFIDDARRSVLFTRYVILAKVKGKGCDAQTEAKLVFWPTRRTRLQHGPLPSIYERRLEYALPRRGPNAGKRWLPRYKKRELVAITAKLHLPKLHIIGERLPMQLGLQLCPHEKPLELESAPRFQVTLVRIHLDAVTTVGPGKPTVVSSVKVAQQKTFQDLAIDVPLTGVESDEAEQCQRVNLHDFLPDPGFLIRTEPLRNMNPPNIAGDQQSTVGPIVPSFEAPICTRTYRLAVSLTITCAGKNKMLQVMKSEEIVLLPDRLDTKLAQADPPAQLDGTRDVGRFEAPNGAVVEADGRSRLPEVAADGQELLELADNPAELPTRPAAPHNELPASSSV